MKILFILYSLLLVQGAFAAEADHYTDRDKFLEDISSSVNQKANEYLVIGVAEANKLSECNDSIESEKRLYPFLRQYFGNHTNGQLVKDILYTDEFSKRLIPLKKSIFENWSKRNGFLLGRKAAEKSPLALSPMIMMDNQLVGIDKLEHMFGMGHSYFQWHYIKGKNLMTVLKKGAFFEKTILGGNILATGVFSYGDLSANFNGMRFWNHMLQKRDDVLGSKYNVGPFVICKNKKWEVVTENPIDLNHYIDASMDESINCNKFASKTGSSKYQKSIKLRSSDEQSFQCPMSVTSLETIADKYSVVIKEDKKLRSISHWIINRNGVDKVSYFNEF